MGRLPPQVFLRPLGIGGQQQQVAVRQVFPYNLISLEPGAVPALFVVNVERRSWFMQWSEVSISTSTETQDVVAEIFHDLGASGVVIEDPEVVNGYIREGAWDYSGVPQAEENGLVLVKAYLPADEELPDRMRELAQRLENMQISAPESCGPCKVSSALLRDEDWADNWKAYFHTEKVGALLVVRITMKEKERDKKAIEQKAAEQEKADEQEKPVQAD